MKRISIVVPSLNQAPYIRQCLQSIVDQQYENLQLIVVDGMSSDGSVEIIRTFRHAISHLIVEPDDGQADALTKGFSLADGEILAYLNSDDVYFPGALARVSHYLDEHPEVDAVYGDRVFIDEDGKPTSCWRLPRHSSYLMRRWDYIPQESCFWRKGIHLETGGIDKRLQFAMDYDLFLKFMEHGRMAHVGEFLAAFRVHGQSKTQVLNNTVGAREVDLLKSRHNVHHRPIDRIVGGLLRRWIERRSKAYFSTRRDREWSL